NLYKISQMDIKDLSTYKGIGDAKAIAIVAALELGRGRKEEEEVEKPILNSSKRVYDYCKSRLMDLPHEEFWVLYLNTACKVLDSQLIGRRGNDFTPVDVRIILRYALSSKAHSMILIHNHPSGT